MARRLIVDTGVFIAQERGAAVDAIRDDDDLIMAAITLGELWTGVDLACDAESTAARRGFVERLRTIVPIAPYDDAVARTHGALLAHVRRAGAPRGAHDLIIAATAIVTDRMLLTTDRSARFADLPGLRVLEV